MQEHAGRTKSKGACKPFCGGNGAPSLMLRRGVVDGLTRLGFVLLFLTFRAGAAWFGGGSFDGYDDAATGGAADLPQVSNMDGATDVTSSGARLNGMLMYTGAAPAQVYVYWGSANGETNLANWTDHHNFGLVDPFVPLSFTASLAAGQTYYYRFFASNSAAEIAWAYPESAVFATPAAPQVTIGTGVANGRSSAVLNGELVAGLYADITIFWGTDPLAWSSTNSLGTHTVAGSEIAPNPFRLLVDGLTPDTTYGYVVRAENAFGTDETDVVWFTTREDHFITASGAAWFGGGRFDGYDDETVEQGMPGSGGTLLMFR